MQDDFVILELDDEMIEENKMEQSIPLSLEEDTDYIQKQLEKQMKQIYELSEEGCCEITIATNLLRMKKINELCEKFMVDVIEKDLDNVLIRGGQIEVLKSHNLILQHMLNFLMVKNQKNSKLEKNKISSLKLPKYWDLSHQTTNLLMIPVMRNSEEWLSVVIRFNETMNNKIFQIERIQNLNIYKQYYLHRELLEEKNNGFINESMLFHGSSSK